MNCINCNSKNIESIKRIKKILPSNNRPKNGRKITYGYAYIEHNCKDCNHIWEGERINL